MTRTVTDVICPFCGTLCDDIEVVVSDDGKKLYEVYNACAIGAEKFLHSQAEDRITRPRMRQEDGSWKEITYDEAIDYTARMLVNARKPLMYGWSSTNCEAQAIGSEIGELVGAVVDNTATVCHGTSLIAVQDIGIPSCTLGEIKNRADRILFWGCNPAHAHPRHINSHLPLGFTGKGHTGRKIIGRSAAYRHRENKTSTVGRAGTRLALRRIPSCFASTPDCCWNSKEKIYEAEIQERPVW